MVWEEPTVEHQKEYMKKSQWSYDKQEWEYVDTDTVIEERQVRIQYTLGIDTSGMGADYNQIVVVNNKTKKVVARYGKKMIAEEQLAMIAVEIAKYYHNALIVPEVNYSHEITNFIQKLGYNKIYLTENIARQDMALAGGVQYGFKTTQKTKPAIISNLRSQLNANPNLIQDREFWYEAEYYLMEDPATNKMNASQGHHDDIIMATAIAMYASDSFQSKTQEVVVSENHNDHFIARMMNQGRKTKIRKGIFRNNA